MLVIKNNQIYSDSDKYVLRIDSNSCFKRGYLLKNDTLDMFKEVDSIPKDEEEYKQKVRELIAEKYAMEDEIAFIRQKDTKPDEYAEYNSFVESCKAKAKELFK